jgi:hypothetical protein
MHLSFRNSVLACFRLRAAFGSSSRDKNIQRWPWGFSVLGTRLITLKYRLGSSLFLRFHWTRHQQGFSSSPKHAPWREAFLARRTTDNI